MTPFLGHFFFLKWLGVTRAVDTPPPLFLAVSQAFSCCFNILDDAHATIDRGGLATTFSFF